MQVRLIPPSTEEHTKILDLLIAKTGNEAGHDPFIFGETHYWLIEAEVDGRWLVAGYTGIHSVNWIARKCRGLLWIMPEARRKGIGEEALRVRNAMLFDQFNMNRIEWVIPLSNGARMQMAEKMGQHQEGVLRECMFYDGKFHDYAMFAMLRSDRDTKPEEKPAALKEVK